MRQSSRPLLEGRIDDPGAWVSLPAGIKSIADEVMNREFDRPHIDPPGEAEIGIQQVAMPVLLGGPAPQPLTPRRVRAYTRMLDDIVERDRIIWQRLLDDHVPDKDDEHVIGQPSCRFAKCQDLLTPILRGKIREIVGRLPGAIDGNQQR